MKIIHDPLAFISIDGIVDGRFQLVGGDVPIWAHRVFVWFMDSNGRPGIPSEDFAIEAAAAIEDALGTYQRKSQPAYIGMSARVKVKGDGFTVKLDDTEFEDSRTLTATVRITKGERKHD